MLAQVVGSARAVNAVSPRVPDPYRGRMRYSPDLSRVGEAAAQASSAREVYGEPVERDGVLVIPAARTWSGGGAGGGTEDGPARPGSTEAPAADPVDGTEGDSGGVGFGRRAEPAGAFAVDLHGVRWVPAVDVNRIVLGGQIAFVLAVAAISWAVARRRGR